MLLLSCYLGTWVLGILVIVLCWGFSFQQVFVTIGNPCGSLINDKSISVSFCYNPVIIAKSATDQCFSFWCTAPSGKGLQVQRIIMLMCTHEHNEQNGSNSVLGQDACFISFERYERCEISSRRDMYLTENMASPPVLLQHCIHQMSMYYFILGKQKTSKQINLASRHTRTTKIASLQVTSSFYHSVLFICLPGRSMGRQWQKCSIRFPLRWWQQGWDGGC